jgi:hypothetical protein
LIGGNNIADGGVETAHSCVNDISPLPQREEGTTITPIKGIDDSLVSFLFALIALSPVITFQNGIVNGNIEKDAINTCCGGTKANNRIAKNSCCNVQMISSSYSNGSKHDPNFLLGLFISYLKFILNFPCRRTRPKKLRGSDGATEHQVVRH